MDSPLNQPDAPATGSEAGGYLRLLPNVSTVMAEDLRAALVLAADHDEAITIDARDTVSIGQAGLQLLIAARLEADRLDLPFAIEHARPELIERLTSLGLSELFGLGAEGGKHS